MEDKLSLKDWTIHFLKQRDIYENKIVSINDKDDNIIVKYEDKELIVFIVSEFQDLSFLEGLEKDKPIGIVVLNKKNNLDFLINNWDFFIQFKSPPAQNTLPSPDNTTVRTSDSDASFNSTCVSS